MPESVVESVSEWVEVRDDNGALLFYYSPVREIIRIKERGLTSEVDLIQQRRRWFDGRLEANSLPQSLDAKEH